MGLNLNNIGLDPGEKLRGGSGTRELSSVKRGNEHRSTGCNVFGL